MRKRHRGLLTEIKLIFWVYGGIPQRPNCMSIFRQKFPQQYSPTKATTLYYYFVVTQQAPDEIQRFGAYEIYFILNLVNHGPTHTTLSEKSLTIIQLIHKNLQFFSLKIKILSLVSSLFVCSTSGGLVTVTQLVKIIKFLQVPIRQSTYCGLLFFPR